MEFLKINELREMRLVSWNFLKLVSRHVRFSKMTIITPSEYVFHFRGPPSEKYSNIETIHARLDDVIDYSKFGCLKWVDIHCHDFDYNYNHSKCVIPVKIRNMCLILHESSVLGMILKPKYRLEWLKTVYIRYSKLDNLDIMCMEMVEDATFWRCKNISDLTPLKNCKKLNITDCDKITDNSFCEIQYENIKSLSFTKSSNEHGITISKFVNCKNLDTNYVADMSLDGMKLESLTCDDQCVRNFGSLKYLKYLDCRNCAELDTLMCDSLEIIYVSGTKLWNFSQHKKLKKIITDENDTTLFSVPDGCIITHEMKPMEMVD